MKSHLGSAAGLLMVGGIFLFVSFMMAGDRLGELRAGWSSAGWPSTTGQITVSHHGGRPAVRRLSGGPAAPRLCFSPAAR